MTTPSLDYFRLKKAEEAREVNVGKRFNDVSVLVDEIDMFVGLGAWYEAEYRFKTVDALSGKKSKDQGMINLLLASDRVQELRRKVIEALNKENLPHR